MLGYNSKYSSLIFNKVIIMYKTIHNLNFSNNLSYGFQKMTNLKNIYYKLRATNDP